MKSLKSSDRANSHQISIVTVNPDKCKPLLCQQECRQNCTMNLREKKCVIVEPSSKVVSISESECSACGECEKVCPFEALSVTTVPKYMKSNAIHRYGPNAFLLHRIPVPKIGKIIGLVGSNGTGKTTALQILSSKIKPNMGNHEDPPSQNELLKTGLKGFELFGYFGELYFNGVKASMKPQHIESLNDALVGNIRDIISSKDSRCIADQLCKDFDFEHLLDRDIKDLSGGELQRLAIIITLAQNIKIFMFDEPSTFLDIKLRLQAAQVIRKNIKEDHYAFAVEHDLVMLDALSDYVCCFHGVPGCYGTVTLPFSVREGINVFLKGYDTNENYKFRDSEMSFKNDRVSNSNLEDLETYNYPKMEKSLGDFKLTIEEGSFKSSQIVVMLGENGTGKSTLIKILAGKDEEFKNKIPEVLKIAYKPQNISPKFQGTVLELFELKLNNLHKDPIFDSTVIKPLKVENLFNKKVQSLSGGELQRIALVMIFATPADVYLIDEPSAYLDSETRIYVSKVIKKFIISNHKAAFIVEHDFIMATYLADQVIVYEGIPGRECKANRPQSLVDGMNKFLAMMGITFRRDPSNFRPRINKIDSQKDKEQKLSGNHFVLEE